MLYLYLGKNNVKLLSLKKSVMGQYEAFFFEKDYQTDLFDHGKLASIDMVASAVKETLTASKQPVRDRNIFLILPQDSFRFLRMTLPADIALSAIDSFIADKARSTWQTSLENYYYDYLAEKTNHQSAISLFAIDKENYAKLREVFDLIDYRIADILPETLAYFKLFDKTLRKEKNEKILYTVLKNKTINGYLYDSVGLLSPDKLSLQVAESITLEQVLKQEADRYEQQGKKLSRLILSGEDSDDIRQDTFTKAVGVWTNPLKRIASGFYQDQLKQLITGSGQTFSILKFDVCFGGFMFAQENSRFSLLKKRKGIKAWSGPKINLTGFIPLKKEAVIFTVSFILSFILFVLVSRAAITLPKLPAIKISRSKPSPTPTLAPTATPTPVFGREDLKLKVLNGSGMVGKAADVKTILEEKGYGEILTGNADRFDYEKTEIQIKKNRRQAVNWLKSDLTENAKDIKISTLDDSENADLILIIGKDFK